jgi:DNA-binding NarL/FixJ family response regulator
LAELLGVSRMTVIRWEQGKVRPSALAWQRLELAEPRWDVRPSRRADGLTVREIEVLRLLAAGRTNSEIASALVISVRTVERHIETIYSKVGAPGKAARTLAAAYAHREGLLREPA